MVIVTLPLFPTKEPAITNGLLEGVWLICRGIMCCNFFWYLLQNTWTIWTQRRAILWNNLKFSHANPVAMWMFRKETELQSDWLLSISPLQMVSAAVLNLWLRHWWRAYYRLQMFPEAKFFFFLFLWKKCILNDFWFPYPFSELPFNQQLSRNPGLFVHEGCGSEVVEESLHVSASLRVILLNKRDLKGDSKFIFPHYEETAYFGLIIVRE